MRRPRHPRDEFPTWIKDHPPPSLQDLITQYDGYDKVPPKAWEYYDAHCKNWEKERRTRLLGSSTWEMMDGMKKDTRHKLAKKSQKLPE